MLWRLIETVLFQSMRKLFVFIGLTALLFVVSQEVNAKSIDIAFKNCSALNKRYSKGVTKNMKTAKLTGAKYSPSLYRTHLKLDRDKDGIACERTNSSSHTYSPIAPTTPEIATGGSGIVSTSPVTVTTSPVTVTTSPVTCESISPKLTVQNVKNVTVSYKTLSQFPDILSSFEIKREVSGQLKNASSIDVYVVTVIAKSLYQSGLNKDSPSYEVDNSVARWVTLPKTSIVKNSTLDFSYSYTQYVTAPYGSFADSFDSKVDVHMETFAPSCVFDR